MDEEGCNVKWNKFWAYIRTIFAEAFPTAHPTILSFMDTTKSTRRCVTCV
ncbi:hypothetical protein GQ600_2697 [Phytophthora cactorum]|nr:hypothetical protein GQ600_2697 [Phytophthora cactorum]